MIKSYKRILRKCTCILHGRAGPPRSPRCCHFAHELFIHWRVSKGVEEERDTFGPLFDDSVVAINI